MSWKKFLLIPQLAWYGIRAPRDQKQAWDRYWGGIRQTGFEGDVLWDAASEAERKELLDRALAHLDRALPAVDIGCGNGRYTRALAAHFPKVLGVDVSPQAVARAQRESEGGPSNVEYRVADVSEPGTMRSLHGELGDVNLFVRGVLHVLDPKRREAAIAGFAEALGARGTLFLAETNIGNDPLEHLVHQGATPTSMPAPLRRCIEAGIRPPSHFGEPEVKSHFPDARWKMLVHGKMTLHGIPLTTATEIEPIPAYFAVVQPRAVR
jgi:SAM-dependent methyltransferase